MGTAAAKLIRDARASAGLSLAELAELGSTSKATLSAYENAKKDPGAATLDRLLQACGLELAAVPSGMATTPAEVSRRFSEPRQPPTADDVSLTRDGRRLETVADFEALIAEMSSED